MKPSNVAASTSQGRILGLGHHTSIIISSWLLGVQLPSSQSQTVPSPIFSFLHLGACITFPQIQRPPAAKPPRASGLPEHWNSPVRKSVPRPQRRCPMLCSPGRGCSHGGEQLLSSASGLPQLRWAGLRAPTQLSFGWNP